MAGAYCKFCDHRCFVYRIVRDAAGRVTFAGHLATCAEGKAHDRKSVGADAGTALNPMNPGNGPMDDKLLVVTNSAPGKPMWELVPVSHLAAYVEELQQAAQGNVPAPFSIDGVYGLPGTGVPVRLDMHTKQGDAGRGVVTVCLPDGGALSAPYYVEVDDTTAIAQERKSS